jgi:hypothetical protein
VTITPNRGARVAMLDAAATSSTATDAVHAALVSVCGSARITRAHAATAAEPQLFILQCPISLAPEWLAASHLQLVDEVERRGPEALEEHLHEGAARIGGIHGDGHGEIARRSTTADPRTYASASRSQSRRPLWTNRSSLR